MMKLNQQISVLTACRAGVLAISSAMVRRGARVALGTIVVVGGTMIGKPQTASADILVSFSLSGQDPRASSDGDPNSVASPINDGPGFSATVDGARGNLAPGLIVDYGQVEGTSNTTAVTAEDYFTFSLSPSPGHSLSLSSFSFDYANYSTDGVFSPVAFFSRSSVNNFSSNLTSTVTATASSMGAFATSSSTLGAAFQNLSGPIEFRIYLQESTANTNTARGFLIDNIIVQGVAVPEPSTSVALIGGMSWLVGLRRLRQRRSAVV